MQDEPLVMLYSSTRTGTHIDQFFAEHDFVPNVVMTSGSFEVVKRYVREGLGIAILPEMVLVPGGDEDLHTVTLQGLPTIGIGAIWDRGR